MREKTIKARELNIAYVWNGFKDNFGEPKVKPKKFKPKSITLTKEMLDSEILAEYKPEEITLDEFAYLLESKEGLLNNGYANISYIRDEDKLLWAVDTRWRADDGGWYVDADSVTRPSRWGAGLQVVSRNLILSSSDTLPENPKEIIELETLVTKIQYKGKTYILENLTPPKE